MRTRFSLLVPAVALATALTACGDDGPSKAEYITKADAACASGNTTISTTAKPTNAPQVASAAGTAVSTIDGQVTSLRALKTPGGADKSQIQGFITALADVSAPTKALQDAAGKSDDVAMAKAAQDMQAKADTAATSAQTVGLAQCGTQLKFGLGNMFDGVKNVVKSSYVTKANSACTTFVGKVDALTPPGNSMPSVARFLDAFLVHSTKLATDLKALAVPPGDQGTIDEFLGSLEALNTKFRDASAAAKANNGPKAVSLLDDIDSATDQLNAKFDAYGLQACGSGN